MTTSAQGADPNLASLKVSAQRLGDLTDELEQLLKHRFSLPQEDSEAYLKELRFQIHNGHRSCPTCGTHFAVEGQRP